MHYWWECKFVQSLWKTVWRLLKKLKLELPYDPAIPFLGIYLKECKVIIKALAHSCVLQHIHNSYAMETVKMTQY
jgi:hypothetical protein